jgi:hypothetical protein
MNTRRNLVIAGLLLSLATACLVAAWYAYVQVGRTPSEIVDYINRRLQGHPKLEAVLHPVLTTALDLLGEPDAQSRALPFLVPSLPPNPATAGGSGTNRTLWPLKAADGAQTKANLGRVLRVGPGQSIASIGLAAQMARDGDTIEIDPGDYVADVAVWDRDQITLRGMGPQVRLIAAGAHAEGKAIWVIRRGRVLVENIEFVGASVPDGNGAGIRFESGHLIVRNCHFHGNQTGLLTGGVADAILEVENSEFGYNGAGDGLTHGLYVGTIQSLKVTGSYFHHGNVGQLIKSRARNNDIAYNRLTDESGGRSSYELEFPNGGVALVIGNIIQQGSGTLNSVMVSFGVEGYKWPQNRLLLSHNTLVNDRAYGGTFVRVSAGADQVVMRNNLLAGFGQIQATSVLDAAGDRRVGWPDFHLPAREDYRLKAERRDSLLLTPGAPIDGALVPRFEYQHPRGLKPLSAPPRYPGAVQTAAP